MRLVTTYTLWNLTGKLAYARILDDEKPEAVALNIAYLERHEFEMQNEFLTNLFDRFAAEINAKEDADLK